MPPYNYKVFLSFCLRFSFFPKKIFLFAISSSLLSLVISLKEHRGDSVSSQPYINKETVRVCKIFLPPLKVSFLEYEVFLPAAFCVGQRWFQSPYIIFRLSFDLRLLFEFLSTSRLLNKLN